jgi:hypothetical protein
MGWEHHPRCYEPVRAASLVTGGIAGPGTPEARRVRADSSLTSPLVGLTDPKLIANLPDCPTEGSKGLRWAGGQRGQRNAGAPGGRGKRRRPLRCNKSLRDPIKNRL